MVQPSGLRLYGRRVMLRPLTSSDFPAWSEVRLRNEYWLIAVGAAARPPTRSTRRATATRSRRAARRATASGRWASAYGFGLFVDHALRRRGQPQQRRARRDADRHDRLLDRPGAAPGKRYVAEGVVVLARFAFEDCTCTAWRSASSRATPTAAG